MSYYAIFMLFSGGELICYVAMRQRVGRFNMKIPLISSTFFLQFFAGCASINLAAVAVLSAAPVFQRTFYCLNRPRYMKAKSGRGGNGCEVLSREDTSRIFPHKTWDGSRKDVQLSEFRLPDFDIISDLCGDL